MKLLIILPFTFLCLNIGAKEIRNWHIWIEESRSAGTLSDRNSRAYKNNKLIEYIIENELNQGSVYSVYRGWRERISPSVVRPYLISGWEVNSYTAIDSIWRPFTPKSSTDSMPLFTLGTDFYTNKRNNEISNYLNDDEYFNSLGIIAVSTWGSTSAYEKLLYKLSKRGVYIYTINIADQKYSRTRAKGKINYCQGSNQSIVVECFKKAYERSKGDPSLYEWDNTKKVCKNHLGQRGLNDLKAHQHYHTSKNMDCLNLSGMDFSTYPGSEYPIQTASLNGTTFSSSKIKDKVFYNTQILQNTTFIDNDIENVEFKQDLTSATFNRNRFKNVTFANKITNSSFKELNDFSTVTFKNLSNVVFEEFTGDNVTLDPSTTSDHTNNIFKGDGQTLNNWIIKSDKKPNESECRISLIFENLNFNNLQVENIDLCEFRLRDIKIQNSSIQNTTAKETNFTNTSFSEIIPFDNTIFYGVDSDIFENVQFIDSKSTNLTLFGLAKLKGLNFSGGEYTNLEIRGTKAKAAVLIEDINFQNTLPSTIKFNFAIISGLSMETIPYDATFDVVRLSDSKLASGYGPKRGLILINFSSEDLNLSSQGFDSLSITKSNLKNLNAESLKATTLNIESSLLDDANFKKLDVNTLFIKNSSLKNSDFREAYNLSNQVLTNTDFSGANLSKLTFHGTNLKRSDFNNANLKESNFDQTTQFENNSFKEANFYGTNLNGVKFNMADFQGAIDFSYPNENLFVTCNQCNFENTELKATFKSSSITNSSFDKANISNGLFHGELENVTFRGTTFKGVTTFGGEGRSNFKKLNLNEASFEGTTVFQNFEGENIVINNAYLKGASFNNLDINNLTLVGSILANASFYNSNFSETSFVNSDLKNSSLSNISLKRGEIKRTDFLNSNLNDVTFEDIEILKILNFGTIIGPLGPASGLSFIRTDFLEENLDGLYLSLSSFSESSLARSSLVGSQLKQVTFDRGSFRGVDLRDSSISQTSFKWVEFPAANFDGATLSSYRFIDSYLSGAKGINQAKWYSNDGLSSFKGSNLSYLDFSGLNLLTTDFKDTILEYTLFNDTNLSLSDFSNAQAYETEFYNATTHNTKFDGIDPFGVLGLAL